MLRWFCKQHHATSSSSPPSTRLIYPSTLIHLNKYDQYSIKSILHNHHHNNNNKIKTTKYTLLTFIPMNIWEQFHRFANVYFVFILILNFLPDINAFAKEIAPLPVLITLAIVAIKDGYEDFRRYLSDCKVNKKSCEVYSISENQYIIEQWQHLRPGDFIRLHMNDIIPADILVLTTSNSTGICHIETSNLDGESNLKQREIVSLCIDDEITPLTFLYPIEVEAPNAELYKFNGKIILPEKQIPIHKNNMLLRGCVLRNTDYVIGIVIYTGRETKTALNNSGVRFKRSKLEKQINMDVIWCVLILVVVCFTGAIGSAVWHQNLPGDDVLFVALDRNSSTSSPAYQGFLNFWRFVIIFQTIIPLPLYITIEFVKMHQVWHMNNDLQLYDDNLNQRIEIRAFNIPEDLGQIEYVFTDKTGTLTENKMKFQRASINGNDYNANDDDDYENNERFSRTSSPDHTITKLNTLRNLLENKSIFAYHHKTIHNDEFHFTEDNSKKVSSLKQLNNKSIQQSNSIPSTSHNNMDNDDFSSYLTNHRTSSSSSSSLSSSSSSLSSSSSSSSKQHLHIDADFQRYESKQQENNEELSNTTNNNHYTSTVHESQKNSSNRYLLTDEIRIQDYFLALAICNTAVVSVTKNTSTLFQEPPRRKGFRDYFRSGKFKSVTHIHQKLFKTNHQQQPKSKKQKQLNKSMLTLNRTDKQTTSTSSLLSNRLQVTRSNEMNTRIEQSNNNNNTNTNRLCNDYIINSNDCMTILNENISQETLIIDEINSKVNNIDKQSMNINDNHHDNISSMQTINCNHKKKLLKINVLSVNSARTFNEQIKHIHNNNNNNSVVFLSSRCLPPVIEALNLDVSIKNSQHILNISHSDEEITSDYIRSPRQQQPHHHHHHHSNIHLSQRSLSTEDINLQNTSRYIQQSVTKDGLVCIHVLRILPFDSQRKRMSILFRHPYTNEPILFTKGADTSIMNRLDNSELNSCELVTTTQQHIDHYSRMGLRTLVIAERLLTEDELHEWLKEVYEIETGNNNSEEAMMILMDKLERNFILLGATGIEDRLQEGVPETIEILREAGMHVWMLTGDKQETAVNIARSANLITSQHKVMYLNANSESHMEYLLNSYLYGIINNDLLITSNNVVSNSFKKCYTFMLFK
ncbi:hypothetical protein MN116_005567 [Schistosoma mekongi]|uniref:Phospholipid-transporting ATPase n=1 Tax=Schistosoma mekongi TaxID=38744 RepID=A0AAE2D4Q9_SCHME|nr:hypothetical protein MN116_005567 [Schistosoma mekongi]